MRQIHFKNFPLGREKNAIESAKQKISNQQREEHKKMKNANRNLSRLLACALVFLLALTAAIPVFAANTVTQDNLEVVIHNRDGLPKMDVNQFEVYQLFTGTPNREGDKDPKYEADYKDHEPDNWNNYTLADVKWGISVENEATNLHKATDLLDALKKVDEEWAKKDGANVFTSVTDAAGLAKVLAEHTKAIFLQHFAKTVASVQGLVTVTPVDGTPTLTSGDPDVAKDDYLTYKFDKPGYYMFKDVHTPSTKEPDAISEYILAVLGDQEINLKASVPEVKKEIVVDTNGVKSTAKGEAAGVSDYVQFKLTGTLPMDYAEFDSYEYIFHDTLSEGLTFVNDPDNHPLTVRVYASKDAADKDATALSQGTVVPATYGAGTANYTVSETPAPRGDNCNLEITFSDLKALKADDAAAGTGTKDISVTAKSVFVVTYYAKVDKDAVILSVGNPNTVQLEYANDPNGTGTGKTVPSSVYVYAFGLDLTKVDGEESPLEGAGFVLKDKDENGNYAIFEDQWVLTSTDQTTQTFYETKEAAVLAQGSSGGTVTSVRRLTGWTNDTDSPTTAEVKTMVDTYSQRKAELDAAKKDELQNASTAFEQAKTALNSYLLEAGVGSNGELPDVYGLDAATYYLEEVIVPDGYNHPENDFDITITAEFDDEGKLEKIVYTHNGETVTYFADENKYNADNLGDEDVPVGDELTDRKNRFKSGLLKDNIENQKAPLLPFTGGIGTIIFYVLGGTLIVGAIVYLVIVSKKNKKTEENT